MRNEYIRSKLIINLVEALPSFGAADPAPIEENKVYLNIILSRYGKRGTIVRLRKNQYVTKSYIDNVERKGTFSNYVEFAANKLYSPSYLSLNYIGTEGNTQIDNDFGSYYRVLDIKSARLY